MDHYHLATQGDSEGLWDWNLATNRVHFAPRWVTMVGCADHEVGHSPSEWLDRVHPDDRDEVTRQIEARREQGPGEFSLQHRMLHKDGSYRWTTCHAVVVGDEGGRPVRMMGFHSDVTADKVADAVTGLPNRLLFLDRLERAIQRAMRSPDWRFAALVIDLDRGQGEGGPGDGAASNPLLAAAARRLETCLRSGDAPASLGCEYLVSRLGGDQFAVLLENIAHVGDASVSAQRILAGMTPPFSVGGQDVFVQASVGIAVSATGYRRAEEVLRDADTALHRARALGRGRSEVFDTAAIESARLRLEMEAELETAIERNEFVLFYQPIVALETNRIAGLEALVRWRHPRRGLVPPMEFIPLAEKTGAVGRIGNWVVREACRQLSAWRAHLELPEDLWVSVNLSAVQFRDPTLFEQIGSAVRDANLDPRCLMVELTESTVMDNPAAAKGLIMQLRVLGVRIAIDDFGTGHSTLASLHQFPADFLKVDRSFVRGLDGREDMADIVRTVNDLADQLGLEVIVEGVERDEQLEVVKALRCGYVQGFLLARPVDEERTAALLKAGVVTAEDSTPVQEPTVLPDTDRSDGPLWQAPTERAWGWRPLGAAAAAVVLLVSVGVMVQVASGPRTSARDAGKPAATASANVGRVQSASAPGAAPTAQRPAATAPAAAVPARNGAPDAPAASNGANATVAGEPVKTAAAPTVPGARPRADAKETAASSKPAGRSTESFQVVHLHALGRCTGQLSVTPGGVSYVPDKGKDGFAFDRHAFTASVSEGALVIKTEKRTYRFKTPSGSATADAEFAAKAMESITRRSRGR